MQGRGGSLVFQGLLSKAGGQKGAVHLILQQRGPAPRWKEVAHGPFAGASQDVWASGSPSRDPALRAWLGVRGSKLSQSFKNVRSGEPHGEGLRVSALEFSSQLSGNEPDWDP